MRRKFVLFVLIPLVVAGVVVYFFIDRWVESGLEAAGEALVGAKVEIDHLHVSLSPIGLCWDHLQVANSNDPWKNLFETGKVSFALNFGQLLRGKYIIETMEANDVILGTKRATDGSLPKKPAKASPMAGPSCVDVAKTALDKAVETTTGFDLGMLCKGVNVDSLVNALDIQTIKHVDSLRGQITATSKQWDASLADFDASKKKLVDIETNLKAINPSELKDMNKIMAAISTVDNSIKTVNEISSTFKDRRAAIEADMTKFSGSVSTLDDVAKQDFQHLMSMARLPDLNTTSIARMLVGQEMFSGALSYLHWIDVARSNISSRGQQKKEEAPPRMKGQNIHFPLEHAYPKLWIQKILVSGGTDSVDRGDFIRARGEVTNVSNDQSVTGVPLTINLQGTENRQRALTLSAVLDRTKDVPFDEYNFSLSGVPLSVFELGRSDFAPAKVTNARLTSAVSVTVRGSDFDLRTRLDLADVKLEFAAAPRNEIESVVRQVVQDVKGFTVSLRLWTTNGGADVALSTDLADQIAVKLKGVAGAEFAKMQNELKAKLDQKISERLKEFDQFYTPKENLVEKQLIAYQSLVDQQLGAADAKKKELTDRLAKENKGKVEDVLKGILKR